MRVLHVAAALDPRDGGTSEAIPRMAGALAARGHDVALAYVARVPSARSPLLRGTSVNEVILSRGDDELRALVETADVVHVHGVWGRITLQARQHAIRKKIALVSSPHGALSRWALDYRRFRKIIALALFERRVLKATPLFVVTAEHEAADLRVLLPNARIKVVPHGISLPKMDAGLAGARGNVVGFLGRLHPIKGLDLLLEGVARLRSRIPDVRLRIGGPVGAGASRWVKGLRRRGGLFVEWVGEVETNEKWNFLRSCDVIALPSHFENFGLVAGEALGVGRPVVVGRNTAWNCVEERGVGAVVEPTVESVERGLERVLLSSATRERAKVAGPAWIRGEFSWSAVGEQLELAYS